MNIADMLTFVKQKYIVITWAVSMDWRKKAAKQHELWFAVPVRNQNHVHDTARVIYFAQETLLVIYLYETEKAYTPVRYGW